MSAADSLSRRPDAAAAVAVQPHPSTAPRTRSLIRRVLGLAWPVLVENFLQTMVGVVDIFMVSFLGTVALAGVGTSLPMLFVIFSAITAVAMGGTVLVARAVGAKDVRFAGKVAKQTVLLGLGLSVLLTALGVPLARQLIALLGPEPEVLDIGGDYFRITMATSVGLVMMFVLGAVLRGAGDMRTPMMAGMVMNVINVVLAYLLIFGNLGFPEMGAVGSAWAAAVARLVGAGGLAVVLWRGRQGVAVRGVLDWAPHRDTIARLLRIGVPSMLEQFLMSSSMVVFTAMVIGLGTQVFAAQRITFQVLMIGWLPGFAFSIAATTLVGQSLGARNPATAERTAWIAVWAAVIVLIGFGLVFFALAPQITSLFSTDTMIVQLGGDSMRLMSLSLPVFGFSIVLQGALRGGGDTQFPMYTTGILSWLFRLPLIWVVGILLDRGLLGMYGVFIVESGIRGIVTYIRFHSGGWKTRVV